MRTWLYIDGYNFYYGIKNGPSDLPIGLGWCDFRRLAEHYLLSPDDELERIRYFTAPVSKYAVQYGEAGRQSTWLDALSTIEILDVTEGIHLRPRSASRKEKMTDVNIAVELVLDSIEQGGYEKAVILSSDLDLFPAALAVTTRIPKPRAVEFWLSPETENFHLRQHCEWHGIPCSPVTASMLYRSRFPDEFHHDGKHIKSEPRWRLPRDVRKYPWAKGSDDD